MSNEEATIDDTTEQQRCSSTDGMLELDSLRLDGASTQLLAPNSSHHDSDNDDDDSDNDDNDTDGISASYHTSAPQYTAKHTTYFLGTKFNKSRDQRAMSNYSKQMYWLTYRNDLVVPLSPYSATNTQSLVGNIAHGGGLSGVTGEGMMTDAGWGCMLRSAQMLLAQTVRRHYTLIEEKKSSKGITSSGGVKKIGSIIHSSNRRRGGEISQTRSLGSSSSIEHHKLNWKQLVDPIEVERIANWFADFPNHPDYNLLQDDITSSDEKNESNQEEQSSNTELEEVEYGNGGLAFHWYSLHQMVAAGLGLGVLPGEWYGPTTACHVLREINEMHVDRRERLANILNLKRGVDEETDTSFKCDMFRVHVATEGCVYLDAIAELMNQNGGIDSVDDNKKTNVDDPLSLSEIDDPLRPPTQQQKQDTIDDDDIQWDKSLLLLLPLRLGIQSISTSNYGSTLSRIMSFPHSVGMLGGTPRHALFFYGADAVDPPSSSDGAGEQVGGWYGLDPHTVQMAPRGTQVLCNNGSTNTTTKTAPKYQWQVQLTDSYLRSLHFSSTTSHANHERSIPLSSLDPSCALGFYIHDYSGFVHFQRLLKELSTEHCKPNKLPEVVTVLDKTPNYEIDVSAAINDMIRTEGNGVVKINDDIDGFSMQSDDENTRDDDDDDDDFVLI